MKKNILITGGAGFIGANLAIYLQNKMQECKIICLDNLSRLGSRLNIERLKDVNIKFIKGDIRDKKKLLKLGDIALIIECSADPSVLAAYQTPDYTIDTNLIGTMNCLELAKKEKAGFIFLSTSRVYPIENMNSIPFTEENTRFDWTKDTLGQGYSFEGINEDFLLNGVKSLYGATKLSSEQIMIEYLDMYGLQGVINRFGVVAGPWQMGKVDQGFISFWIANHKFDGKLDYIGYGGSGKQVRDILHVGDLCDLIFEQINNIERMNKKIFNAGGGRSNSISLSELTQMVEVVTAKQVNVGSIREERKADVRIYITDNSYVSQVTGWKPSRGVEQILLDTNKWIDDNSQKLQNILI